MRIVGLDAMARSELQGHLTRSDSPEPSNTGADGAEKTKP